MIVRTILKAKPSYEIATTAPDAAIDDVSRLLFQKRIGALIVTDKNGQIVGIISERDIVRGLALHGAAAPSLKVRDLMTSAVLVCSPDDSLEKLMGIMTNRRIRHLPVVENGQLAGIITIGDVVKSRMEQAAMEVESMRGYVMSGQ